MEEHSKSRLSRIRRRLHEIVEIAAEGDRASHLFDLLLLTLIIANVIATIVETVAPIQARWGEALRWFEVVSILVFTIEYVARVWSATANPRFSRPVLGRVRFVFTPLAIVDFLAILPFYLAFGGALDLRFVRILRVFRLFRLLKLTRYATSVRTLAEVLRAKKEELVVAVTFALILLVFASSLLYFAEHAAQPDAFSNIPASMWWGVSTLTTVGYGDVYPVTTVGRILGGTISLIGVGIFALPAGILAAGFSERIRKERRRAVCPHCGGDLGEGRESQQ